MARRRANPIVTTPGSGGPGRSGAASGGRAPTGPADASRRPRTRPGPRAGRQRAGGPPAIADTSNLADSWRPWWPLVVLVLVGGFAVGPAEASPSGPRGPRSSSPCRSGTGTGQMAADLAAKGVISSSLAYRIWSQFHHPARAGPAPTPSGKNSSFAGVDRVISGRSQRFPPGGPARIHRGRRWPTGWASSPATREAGLRRRGHRRHGPVPVATGRLHQSRRPARNRHLRGGAGRDRHQLLTAMVARFDSVADRLDLASRRGRPRADPVPGRHRGLHRREGGCHRQEPGSGGPGHPQPAGQRNMPLQMDSTVLYSEGRDGGHGHLRRPGHPLAVQHLPEQGTHPHPDLLPLRGRPAGGPRPPHRDLAVLRGGGPGRDRGLRRHLRPAAGQ